jgi:hypothetical protein
MNNKLSAIAVVLLLCACVPVFAQKAPVANPILSADSLATGNYKDVLNSFFQLAFDRLGSPDKEIKFTGTPFAVMAKLDTTLLVDKKYRQYSTLRNLNYVFGLRLDSAYKFNGFTSGIKYALWNKRDETVSDAFVKTVENNEMAKLLYSLNDSISIQISKIDSQDQKRIAVIEFDQFTTGAKNFNALSLPLQKAILVVLEKIDTTGKLVGLVKRNRNFNLAQTTDSLYNDMRANFHRNPLLTVGFTDTTYKDQFVFTNMVFYSEFLKGINNYNATKNDLELNILTKLQLVDDTLKAGRDLKRAMFSFEPGINVAFKTRQAKKSYLEIKFSGSYYHNFSTLYASEDRDRIMANATVRIRILNDIWVPFEIKYDPKNGNLLGFINVRANFKALAGAARQL